MITTTPMLYGGKSNGGSGDGAGRGYDGDVNGDVEPPKKCCVIINLVSTLASARKISTESN